MSRVRALALLALLPHAVAALWPTLTPARALCLGLMVEIYRPRPDTPAGALDLPMRQGSLWWLLHVLRPDASWLAGAGILAVGWFGRPIWRRKHWRRLAPLAAVLVLPWTGVRVPSAAPVQLDPGIEVHGLAYLLPERLLPWPLHDSPQQARARLWLAMTLGVHALAGWVGGQRTAAAATWLGFLLAAGGSQSARDPRGLVVEYEAEGGQRWRLEVHAPGSDLYDPRRGRLLLPAAAIAVTAEDPGGLYRVVSAAPWAVAVPLSEGRQDPQAPGRPAAWIDRQPGRPERSGGPELASWRGTLRLWAAGDPTGTSARWEVDPAGPRLARHPLP